MRRYNSIRLRFRTAGIYAVPESTETVPADAFRFITDLEESMTHYVRFEFEGSVGYGILDGDMVEVLDGNFMEGAKPAGKQLKLADVKLLTPVVPPNIICIGLNYKPHAAEFQMKLPELPLLFIKTTTSLADPEQEIVLPKIAPDHVDYEGELVIIIGKTAKNVSEEEAEDYIFGYTIANDVSARDCQTIIDSQWARGKSFDTFCPMGPAAVTGIDANHLHICTRLNGKTMQDSNTEYLIFDPRKLVSFISHNMTLLPGTVILSGTPGGVGFKRVPPVFMKAGDTVEIEIENIGILRNTVVEEK